MNDFRAARNQIHSALQILADKFGGGPDCEWASDMNSRARKIFEGGKIEPYDLNRVAFGTEEIAAAAVAMSLDHFSFSSEIKSYGASRFVVNTFEIS